MSKSNWDDVQIGNIELVAQTKINAAVKEARNAALEEAILVMIVESASIFSRCSKDCICEEEFKYIAGEIELLKHEPTDIPNHV